MPRPSQTELIVKALLARGYSECRAASGSTWRTFRISPNHSNRLDRHGDDILVGSPLVLRWRCRAGKPLSKALRTSLAAEGIHCAQAQRRGSQATPKATPIATLLEIDL